MKKLFFILLLVFPFFVQAELPFPMKFAEIDERLNDVYYVNGMTTTEEQTWESLRLIIESTKKDIYNGNITAMKKELAFDILFIESHSSFEKMIMEFKQQKLEDRLFWIAIDAVYNFSDKEKFGDTYIAKPIETDLRLSSCYEAENSLDTLKHTKLFHKRIPQ
jgi:hypothetical protein